MKRKVLLGLLAFGGGLTVVGSGFSAWYFNVGDINQDGKISHHVTDLNSNAGALTDLNDGKNLFVVFDQGGFTNANDTTKGLSIHEYDSTKEAITDSDVTDTTLADYIGAKYTIGEKDYTTLMNAGVKTGVFKSTFTLSDTAAKYIKFKAYDAASFTADDITLPSGSDITNLKITDTTVTYSYTFTYPTTYSLEGTTFEVKFNCKTVESVNKILEYQTADEGKGILGKPQNSTAYATMKEALRADATNPVMALNYSFTVGANA